LGTKGVYCWRAWIIHFILGRRNSS
jgi:hypothetical protein